MKEKLKYRKIKKKILIFILFYFLFKVVGWFIPRSEEKMKELAYEEIEDYIKYDVKDETILKKLRGPLKKVKENKITFCWYYVTEWGDTAKICARVYKTILSAREDYKDWLTISGTYSNPQITMNYEWYYLLFGEDSVKYLPIPDDAKLFIGLDSLSCKEKVAGIELLKDTCTIVYILKRGYYSDLNKYYEHISTIKIPESKEYKSIGFFAPTIKITMVDKQEYNVESVKIFYKNDTLFIFPFDDFDNIICRDYK